MPEERRRRGRPPLTPEQRAARTAPGRNRPRSVAPLENRLIETEEDALEVASEYLERSFQTYGETISEIATRAAEDFQAIERTLKVHIYPHFNGEDQGDGGIRRVVEAQAAVLPQHRIEVVATAEEADVIAYHATVPPPYINLYPRKAFVAICHGLYWSEYEWGNWALKANSDVMEGIRVSDRVIACSEWVANSIRRNASRNVDVIYHGVDMAFWNRTVEAVQNEVRDRQIEKQPFVLWNKTRPDPICDPIPMNMVASIMPDVSFVSTFGEPAANVVLTGKLPYNDAGKLVASASVYLATSRETFGIGTLEAMACGVPIVGFNWGGQAEFIETGIDGWLVPPGDINGLAEGIRWALGPDREDIANAARRKAAAFNWDSIGRQYADVFTEAFYQKQNQETWPRTTIVVTNYNLHEYLPQCLASVKNQVDQDWECIVVDDHSPDSAGYVIAQGYATVDRRFMVVSNDENVYLAEARNVGIRLANGRYILPLDADDMLDPHAVGALADALDADRHIHVAYGNVKFVEEDGVTPTDYGRQFTPGHSSWPYPFSYEQQIQQRNLLPYCSMFRKEAWLQTGGYRRRCKTAEDADFWVRLSSYGFRPQMVTEGDTLIYRNRPGSMSRIQEPVDWIKWFPWSKMDEIAPAGAVTKQQLPVLSHDPILISVIIPVGPGHGKLVSDAVDSVDAQSFRLWECIVVNDTGAPMPTELPAWARVIDNHGPRGVASARNAGIAASKGRWFLPLDADDYLEPDALSFMYEAAKGTGEVIYCDFWQSDMTGKKVNVHQTDDYNPEYVIGKRRQVGGVQREGMIHPVTALTLKEYWTKVGGYDESLPAWEDWDFELALANMGVCERRIAFPLFYYRKHTGTRREDNMASFDNSKDAILRKWGRELWEGSKKLMVCGRCGANKTVSPMGSRFGGAMTMQAQQQNNDAVLLEYVGPKTAATPYSGPSKTRYWFAKGDQKYVMSQDADFFVNMNNWFRRVEIEPEPEPIGSEPILAAPGQA